MEKGVLYRKIDKNRKDRNRNQGGYTLVELIVVICIVLILAGGAVFGVMTWIRWSQFKEQNEYAKTLFSAAQNHLNEYSANGQLGELQEAVSEDGNHVKVVDVESLRDTDGDKYDLDKVWPESKEKTDKDRYRDDVCYLMGDADTYKIYQEYQNGERQKIDKEIEALYDLLLPYLYDPSILNASVCVEFTPDDGQVFAVLYSNKNRTFEYDLSNSSDSGLVDISDRTTSVRKKRMVGYFGVDTLSKATTTKVQKPSITDVKLNNEDTLNLSFRINKVKESINAMTYEIGVCDKETKNKKLVIQLDGTKLLNKESVNLKPIICKVTRYGNDGKQLDTREYPFLVWMEENETVRMVLDAADLSATTTYYNGAMDLITADELKSSSDVYEIFRDTYSFKRFGVDTEDIYCTVKGLGTYYKPTARKQSNSTNTYFYSYKSVDNNDNSLTYTYAVSNARHLYNIRYREDLLAKEAKPEVIYNVYELTQNINWKQFITGGSLYDTDNTYRTENVTSDTAAVKALQDKKTAFPSICRLNSNSVLESRGDKAYTVSGLTIEEKANSKSAVYGTETVLGKIKNKDNGPTGLFVTNNGKMKNVSLDQIEVKGTNSVGAFCGENDGVLDQLTVNNSDAENNPSTIVGKSDVGGITGAETLKAKAEYKNLVNRAEVTGKRYVGGIIGQISVTGTRKVIVEKCENYGVVQAEPFNPEKGTDAASAKYIGGIIGLCNNNTSHEDSLQIKECKSSPQYIIDDDEDLFKEENKEKLTKELNGVYVGGIVGYNRDSLIIDCNTEKEKNQEGYIFGYQYVGGIVGYNESSTIALDGNKGINETNVIGDSYVGGICGANTGVLNPDDLEDAEKVPEPSFKRDESKIVSNWINRGIVAARKNYVGGITGLNTGIVENCTSEVVADETAQDITDASSLKGDYAGGISGYNNGVITADTNTLSGLISSDDRISLVCYITGKNYVGGIVGYNDVDAEVNNYALTGGHIKGTGTFVGGFAGINVSKSLLAGQIIESNPNEITGKYCVSGTIGGNIIVSDEDIYTEFNSDNFLGNVDADAFAGGFIGYNLIIGGSLEQGIQYVDYVVDTILDLAENKSLEEFVDSFGDIKTEPTDARLTIIGTEEETIQQIRFGSLAADVYVGGVVGYNAEDTCLTISGVINKTPVEARKTIQNPDENEDRPDADYSYAGGIIGKVGKNVQVINCRNLDVGDVTTDGTYLGGICEINDGTIEDCYVSSIGSSDKSFVGGIAGLNKGDGLIQNCNFTEGKTITGNTYVGGIAAENYGVIKEPYLFNGTINAYGNYAGGVAGYNYGVLDLQVEIDKGSIDVFMNAYAFIGSLGRYTGGLIGANSGQILTSAGKSKFTFTGSVSGDETVGGIVGSNSVNELVNLKNASSVTAVNGAAGGIAGESSSSVLSCHNEGYILATKAGDAGGIVSVNEQDGIIKKCDDQGEVTAANGDCGGIAGSNAGYIGDSTVSAGINFEGQKNAGGIAGVNHGIIQNVEVRDITVANAPDSSAGNIGIVVGFNNGTLEWTSDIVAVENSKAYTYVSGSNVGGIAGNNKNSIANAVINNVEMGFAGNNATYANMGGIAGINNSVISTCTVYGNITGDMGGADTGYGGIAGVNNSSISDCSYEGSLLTNGSADNIVNLGGIAGKNNSSASIMRSFVGIQKTTVIKTGNTNGNAAMGYVGGLAGWNLGTVLDSDNYTNSTASVTIENYAGHTGGIVGYQAEGAVVGGEADNILSTGRKWSVISRYYSNDAGTGGIIGYSASGQDIRYVSNYAGVSATSTASNVTAGGMIGRMENKENNAMRIEYAHNYGSVNGMLSGGLIARLKYKGATFINSTNHGTIKGSNGSAGLVASFYRTDRGTSAVFDNCGNYGNIDAGSSSAGGITGIADSGNDSDLKVIYTDCVNVGCISGGTIGGISASGNKEEAYFYRCRNYGNSKSDAFAGIVSANYKVMQDCISITNKKNLTNKEGGTILDSYYLGSGEIPEPPQYDGVYLSNVDHSGTINTGNPVENLYSLDESRFAFNTASEQKYAAFYFKNSPALTNFGVFWANNGEAGVVRKYRFTVSCNSSARFLTAEGTWSDDPNQAYIFTSYGTDSYSKSYWSTDLSGDMDISDIRLEVVSVRSGKFSSSGKFEDSDKNGADNTNVCIYAVSASAEVDNNISTSDAVYEAERNYQAAKTEKEAIDNDVVENQKKLDDAKEAYEKVRYQTDWEISYGPKGKVSVDTDINNIFKNLSLEQSKWNRGILKTTEKEQGFQIILTAPEGGKAVDGLKILWAGNANNDNSNIRTYKYTVTFHYADDTSTEPKEIISQGCFYKAALEEDLTAYLDRDKSILSIEINISSVTEGQGVVREYACLWYIDIANACPEKGVYEDAQKVYDELLIKQKMVQNELEDRRAELEAAAYYTGSISGISACTKWKEPEMDTPSDTDSPYGHKAVSGKADGLYVIQGSEAIGSSHFKISGLQYDPTSGFNDFSQTTTGNRYKVYAEVDEKVKEYYTKGKETPDGIQNNVNISNAEGVLKFSWIHKGRDYYADQIVYRVTRTDGVVEEYFTEPITVSYGIQTYSMNIPDNWYNASIEVFVRSVSGQYVPGDYDSLVYGPEKERLQDYTSAWVKAEGVVQQPQAAPKVHLELEAYDKEEKTGTYNYVAVLENKDDYKGDKDTTVIVNINGKEHEIKTSDGRSAGFTFNHNENQLITTYAKKNDKYAESIRVTVQSALYGGEQMNGNDYVVTKFNDFYGDRPGNLYNQVTMDSADGKQTELYMNSELVISDYQFKNADGEHVKTCDVSVAYGNSHVTQLGGTMTSNLNDLPSDLLNYGNITVRTYPWQNQAFICWYGHPVKSGITQAELISYMDGSEQLVDSERLEQAVFTKDGLSSGYVLRLNANETYDIIYSAVLANTSTYSMQIDEKVYRVSEGKVSSGSYVKKIQPVPSIEESNPLSENGKEYTFIWDRGFAEEDAVYEAALSGITSDGVNVLLDTVTVDKNVKGSYQTDEQGYWTYTFEDTEEVWNYPRVSISILRVGTLIDKKTEKFPVSSSVLYPIKLRFSQISRPVVSLHKGVGGTQKNSLIYDVLWSTVPSEQEREEAASYEIIVRPSDAGAALVFESVEECKEALNKAEKLYECKEDVKIVDVAQDSRMYTWTENINGADVEKSMLLTWNMDEKTLNKNLTEIWTFPVLDVEKGAGSIKKLLDLNDYERNEEISISVRALSGDDAEMYRDGQQGVAREITLPDRLIVPDMASLIGRPEYAYHEEGRTDTYVTQEDFKENGITLTMEDTDDNYYQGKYEIAVAVYENRQEEESDRRSPGDAPTDDQTDSYWNSGAIETLISKSDEITMDGNFNSASYQLKGMSTAYGGKWLKIVMRSVSDSNISSWWTDEDETAEGTVNYKWIRIPRLQTEEPVLSEETAFVYYDAEEEEWSFEQHDPNDIPAEQTELRFSPQKYGDGYRIQRVHTASGTDIDPNTEYLKYDTDWIYLEAAEDGKLDIYCNSSSNDFGSEIMQDDGHICKQDITADYVGTIEEGGEAVELPLTETAIQDADSSGNIFRSSTILKWETGSEGNASYFRLILPDVEKVLEYTDDANRFTAQVSVQSVVLDENIERYESSNISNWYQFKMDESFWERNICSLQDYGEGPRVTGELSASGYSGVAYQFAADSEDWLVYQVEVTDSQGNTADIRYLSSYGVGIRPNVRTLLTLEDEIYSKFAPTNGTVYYISLRAAYIYGDGGGISKWSDWTDAQQIPKLQRAEEVRTNESAVSIKAIVTDFSGAVTELEAEGRKIQWEFDQYTDTKITGYRIQTVSGAWLEVYKGNDGVWYLRDEENKEVLLSQNQIINIAPVSLLDSGEGAYALSADIYFECRTVKNGMEFTVTLPEKSLKVQLDNQEFEFVNDEDISVLPIPKEGYQTVDS